MTKEEQDFLAQYDLSRYDRPSVTTDMVILKLSKQQEDSYRRDKENQLSMLLIRRGGYPFKGQAALPGGFLQKGETVEACALRECMEETGVEPEMLLPVGVYSAPGRDPRGWIVSQAFLSITLDEKLVPKGGDDASEAFWARVVWEEAKENDGQQIIRLSTDEKEWVIRLLKTEKYGFSRYTILDAGGLAFDHARIIGEALELIRERAKDLSLVLHFLPPSFTLAELMQVQEILTGKEEGTANFRRKAMRIVQETEQMTEGAGHRPARLYCRKENL